MSNQVETWMVKQYSANVERLVQQSGSRFLPYVRMESMTGEEQFFDQIGVAPAPQRKTGRHASVVLSETPHARRRVTFDEFYYADMVDKEDKLRTINDPTNPYAEAAKDTLQRQVDDSLITAALGTAYTGKTGSTSVVLPDAQKRVGFDGSDTTGALMNVKAMRGVKKKFFQNEALDNTPEFDDELNWAVAAEQIDSLLGQTEVTNSDYASVKALVQGAVDTFMGFKFIRTERLPATSANQTFTVTDGKLTGALTGTLVAGARRTIVWQRKGLLAVMPYGINTSIDPIPTKFNNKQILCEMGFGATRMEEERVMEVMFRE